MARDIAPVLMNSFHLNEELVVLYWSKYWATKGSDERWLHVVELRMLIWMCGVTRINKVRKEHVRVSVKVGAYNR